MIWPRALALGGSVAMLSVTAIGIAKDDPFTWMFGTVGAYVFIVMAAWDGIS